MTNKDIETAINNCELNDKVINGQKMDAREVICRLYCLPCVKVIDNGKCDMLIELFKVERGK